MSSPGFGLQQVEGSIVASPRFQDKDGLISKAYRLEMTTCAVVLVLSEGSDLPAPEPLPPSERQSSSIRVMVSLGGVVRPRHVVRFARTIDSSARPRTSRTGGPPCLQGRSGPAPLDPRLNPGSVTVGSGRCAPRASDAACRPVGLMTATEAPSTSNGCREGRSTERIRCCQASRSSSCVCFPAYSRTVYP